MNYNEYQTLAARTIATDDTDKMRMHALFGLCSEAAELLEAYIEDEDDERYIIREASDVCWMIAELCTSYAWKLGDVIKINPGRCPHSKHMLPIYIVDSVGELLGIFLKEYQGHQVNPEDVKGLLNDIMLLLHHLAANYALSISDVFEVNIAKLKARYPDGFDPDRSQHRAEGDD